MSQRDPIASASIATQQAFTAIYRNGTWGRNAQGFGTSGPGSTVQGTLVYRPYLQHFLKANAIRSVVDAGCGDWGFSQAIDWTGIDYKGFDIVESVIAQDKQKFERPNIQFFHGNFIEMDLPRADLLLCKHVLQHLPTVMVMKFLPQLSKYKHALLTNGVNAKTLSAPNYDIAPGDYRYLDLTAYPFNRDAIKVLTYWDGGHMTQVLHFMNAK